MNKAVVNPQTLTREVFAPFGDVIEVSGDTFHSTTNEGTADLYADVANVDVTAKGGRAAIDIYRCAPLDTPITIKMMERHPLSSQAFIPMGNNPYLVVVAPKGDFDAGKLQVYLAQSHQGVNYRTGTWHHFCLALNGISDFLVIGRDGEGDNENEMSLSAEQQITISVDTDLEC